MRFSSAAGITLSGGEEWFDPVLEQDSPLYIDPYLIFDDADPMWSGAFERVTEFFANATTLVLAANGARDTPAWRKAARMLKFPEPSEFALGVSLGTPLGAGTGEVFAARIADVLALVGKDAAPDLASIAGFGLFTDGIGVDRISDIISNILKSYFITYTKRVLADNGIAGERVCVTNARWDARGNWRDDDYMLFKSSVTDKAVLLAPKRFLKDIPRVEPDHFWDWAATFEAQALRDDLNLDISQSLTKSEKVQSARRIALQRPAVALRYLASVSEKRHAPYDMTKDPSGLVSWYENGSAATDLIPADSASRAEPSEPEFESWVLALARDFKFVIENTDAWRALWDDRHTSHRPEKIAQAIAGVMWRVQCKAANIDLNKETNIGRGPVDFKFSQGWSRRALLEVKYVGSTHFSRGAEKQLPQYLTSERINYGVYLAIAFTDRDLERDRLRLVEETCASIAGKLHRTIDLVVVDARPKLPASKL